MGTLPERMRSLCLLWSVLFASVLGGAAPDMATALEVGEHAPDFTLIATHGRNFRLSQFKGQKLVLLEFYMADFMPTDAANLSARKADYSKFRELNVQILGISSNYASSQKAFADSLGLQFPLLSDMPELKAIRSFGVLHATPIMARRAFFLLDQQGVVRGRWFAEDETVFPSETILQAAREIVGRR